MTTTREAALEAALRKLELANDAACGARPQRVYDAMIAAGMSGRLLELDEARREARNALAARPAPQPAADTRVVVKPLEWVENPDLGEGGFLGGGVTNSTYHAMADGWCFHRAMFWKKAPSIEAAKAAAQADYEARILSAIIGTATPAQSDKIAEAARVLDGEYYADQLKPAAADAVKFGIPRASFLLAAELVYDASLRALAGKGE